jgi:excisionase family DNA binding protein
LKLSAGGRRGLIELGRAAHKRLQGRQTVELRAMGVVDSADEVLVVVVTQRGALVRRSKIRGREPDARELQLQLAGAEAAIDEVARMRPEAAGPQLSSAEAAMLDEAGLVVGPTNVPSALERSRIELQVLVRSSLTIDEAAKALGVTTSRIRQRLSSKHPTMYGVKQGRVWRIPRFQFESRTKLVRGLDAVMPHIRRDAHPVVVRDWFTTPHQDLVVDDEAERVTPRAWLSSGRSVDAVAQLADEI